MVPEKGVCDAIRVLADLRTRSGMDVELVLAGSGPALAAAMSLAERLGVGDRVEHRPWLAVPDMAELYRQTHVVLAPSRSTARWVEQFGRMIVEAQASGCVVVGYESGSIPEVGGDAALLVREGDVEALAAAAMLILSDPDQFEDTEAVGPGARPGEDVVQGRRQAGRPLPSRSRGRARGRSWRDRRGRCAREQSRSSADRRRPSVKPDPSPSPTSAAPPR